MAVAAAALTAFHPAVPDAGGIGSLLEAFLPWLGLVVPVLFVTALVRRSAVALVVLLLPAAVWGARFGPLLLPADRGAADDLVVVQHNVADDNPDPAGTAAAVAAAAPDLIALEELTPAALPAYTAALAGEYPHHAVEGTVGLWSKRPLTGVRRLDIRPAGIGEDWNRGLRAVVGTARGEVAVYVAHLPSVRIRAGGFASGLRDDSAARLGAAVAAEEVERVVLLGDLNSTVDDRGLAPVTVLLDAPRRGFALSWPAAFPVSRIDQVLARSVTVTGIRALPATGSDHLPVAARIRL